MTPACSPTKGARLESDHRLPNHPDRGLVLLLLLGQEVPVLQPEPERRIFFPHSQLAATVPRAEEMLTLQEQGGV